MLRLGIWLVARETGKKAAPKRSHLGTRLLIDVLTRHILELVTTENHNKREISVVGRSGMNMKKWRKERDPVKKVWLFPCMQCSHDVEN